MKHAWEHAEATVAALASAIRVAALWPFGGLDQVVRRLRRGPMLPRHLRDPVLLAKAADRVVPRIWFWRRAWCVPRSLVLLHLWSRCGLAPTFHLGIRRGPGDEIRGHAWVEAAGAPPGASTPRDAVEVFAA